MIDTQTERLRAAVRWVVSPFRTVALHLLRMTAPRRFVGSIELVDLSTSGATEFFFTRMSEALALLKERGPAISTGIRRRLKRIALLEAGGEFFHRGLKAYVVDLRTLKKRTVPEIALAIVHEGTHARIEHLGIRYEPTNRERIEQLCIRAELAFAERLPENHGLLEVVHRKLNNQWWSEESLHQRRLDQLKGYRVPGWVIRLYDRLFHAPQFNRRMQNHKPFPRRPRR
jgi:hypothetical protein